MSDLDKLFENAPEGATEIVIFRDGDLRWANHDHIWIYADETWEERAIGWKTIATRPQPEHKTVEDAVNDCVCVKTKLEHEWDCVLHDREYYYFVGSDYASKWEHQLVCTREEFEACVAARAAKSELEWTHKWGGTECRILSQIAGKAWIKLIDRTEFIRPLSEIKPIKPTITKADEAALVELIKSSHNLDVINEVRAYISDRSPITD